MVQEEPSFCGRCDQECYGDVINAHGKYYHQYCFTCTKCSRDLIKHGYFVVDGQIYCNNDYYKLMGTKCSGCGKFVEGEVVAVLDSTFHPECFGCNICGKLFPPGAKIAFDGDDFICEDCDSSNMHQFSPKDEYTEPISEDIPNIPDDIPEVQDRINEIPDGTTEIPEIPVLHNDVGSPEESKQKQSEEKKDGGEYNACAGCRNPIKSGQALLALDKQWHLWCFTCNKCGCLLAGEYMGRDGVPYCEDDYQTEFGVSCAGCGGYITGKVLQAGEKHYHPHCSRCAKCGCIFGEGEEMYLQGSDIWHPQCSEDYRRENEEAALNEANAKRLPPSYENTVESMLPRTQSFTISSEDNLQNHADNESIIPSSRPGPPPYHNRSSDISEGDKYTNPPPYHVNLVTSQIIRITAITLMSSLLIMLEIYQTSSLLIISVTPATPHLMEQTIMVVTQVTHQIILRVVMKNRTNHQLFMLERLVITQMLNRSENHFLHGSLLMLKNQLVNH